MAKCLETDSVLGKSEAVFDFYCELCHEGGLRIEAEGFCTNCDEYLCGQCFKDHRKNRFTRHHKVLDIDNMPKVLPSSTDKVKKVIFTTCHQHKDKLVEFYCKSHDKLVCSLCFAADHRSCRDIKSITEDSRLLFHSNTYKVFKQNLASLNQQVRDIVSESRDNSDQCFLEALDSLRRFKEEIISVINELETNLLAQIDKYKTDTSEKAKSISETCATLQETLDNITSEFERLQSTNRVCQTYIRMKETMTEVKDIERQLRQVREHTTFKSLTFVPNEDLRKFLTGPKGIGSLSTEDRAGQKPTQVMYMYNRSPASVVQDSTPDVINSSAFVQDINVRSSNDKTYCWITGSAILSDSKFIVVDNRNCKVKLVDIDSKRVISELQVPEYPWDVTVIKEDQVAIIISNYYSTILVLKVTKPITMEREIKVDGGCRGIAYSKNQFIVTYTSQLVIMDLQGNVISRIENDKDGNKLFKWPDYVCVSSDGDTIYVSDCGLHRVVSLRNGGVKDIYSDSYLEYPTKVCLDHRGNVFVSGYYSRNIQMLKSECTKIKEMLTQTDGLTNNVLSVSHCGLTNKLYVGMLYCNEVKVYQLS